MRLNLQTDYALRLLMHLAVHKDGPATIAEVADRYSISKNHLMKVANALGREGLIDTERGRSGGLRIAPDGLDVRVGDVVRLMEADMALVECFEGGKGECLITPACRLKGVLKDAVDAFLGVLDQYTVKDLVNRNVKLRALLGGRAA
ncbi:RrF2 family transcriptional regulator [Hyphococcus sp.]|uniref:RrF2 family transcriptional regulator n=1 Tax=Hyphococcus sp. TaxID=2038636 RepID=UPI00207D83B3|nr:MAG: HTH-type transcriptional regulator NsrR [Marinicaulis sp.]